MGKYSDADEFRFCAALLDRLEAHVVHVYPNLDRINITWVPKWAEMDLWHFRPYTRDNSLHHIGVDVHFDSHAEEPVPGAVPTFPPTEKLPKVPWEIVWRVPLYKSKVPAKLFTVIDTIPRDVWPVYLDLVEGQKLAPLRALETVQAALADP